MTVLAELLENRETAATELRELIREDRTDALTAEETARVTELNTDLDTFDARIDEESRNIETEQRLTKARKLAGVGTVASATVVDEPMVYGKGANQSYAFDLIRRARYQYGLATADGGATQRLALYEHQIEREIANESKIGKRALEHVRESFRESGPNAPNLVEEVRSRGKVALEQKTEQRGITTGGGATVSASGGGGAAVVSPIIMLDDYAPYKEFGRAFANACSKQELSPYGMEIYIPAVTAGAGIEGQTEGDAVDESDPTLGYRSTAVVTNAGQVTVTQQLLDRAGPNFAFDKLIFDQLNRKYASVFDQYVIAQALANATSQVWAGNDGVFDLVSANGAGGFSGQIQKAAAAMEELEGTVTTPTALFMWPSRWRFIESWSDANGRPIVVPEEAGPFNTWGYGAEDGDHAIEGYTGYKFGGISAFKDKNLPVPTAGVDQAIVADLSQVYVYEGAQNMRAVPQTLAGNLQVILQLWTYGGALPLYPAAVTAISGTGMSAITYTN